MNFLGILLNSRTLTRNTLIQVQTTIGLSLKQHNKKRSTAQSHINVTANKIRLGFMTLMLANKTWTNNRGQTLSIWSYDVYQ